MSPAKRPNLLVLVVISIAIVVVLQSRPVRIAYHKFQMQRAWHAIWDESDFIYDGFEVHRDDEDDTRYEYHRNRLIQLSAVHELKFRLRNILEPSEESKHFSKFLLSTERPNCLDFVSPCSQEPKPMELTVWCYARDVQDWNELIATRDVVGYQTKFGRNRKESPKP